MNKPFSDQPPALEEQPWLGLKTAYDVEAWMDHFNRELQQALLQSGAKPQITGYGLCLRLEQGGEIFVHTTQEGDVLLDLTPEAEWVAPVISAATRIDAPQSQIWALPGHTLTQLMVGLSSLIAATRMVLQHDFKVRKY